jgi:hypothetical protein
VLAVAGGAQGSLICSWHARVLHLLQLPHAAAVCCLPDSKLLLRRRRYATALPSIPSSSPAPHAPGQHRHAGVVVQRDAGARGQAEDAK